MANDTVNVQRGIVGAGADDDTYVLSANLIDDNAQITISDVEGSNSIQLIGGLTISSSIVAGDTAQLTLSNGAVVTVLGASTMSYVVGGNPLAGVDGVTKDYTAFVADVLGTTVPADGEANSTGGESTVNEDGTATGGDPNAPTYALTAGAESVDEGATATFSLATTNVAEGTEVAYTISGVDAADVDGGSLTGTATVAADGTATISVALTADAATEGAETLTVAIDGSSASASSTVNDTSTVQAFTLTSSADNVNEGSNVTVTITATEGAVAGDQVAYTITGVAAEDLVGGALTGTAVLAADLTATVTLDLVADSVTEGEETLTFTLDGQNVSTNIVVNDTSKVSTFALTSATDHLSPDASGATANTTAAADEISGVSSALSSERTLDVGDIVDGGDGEDKLNITMNSSFSGFSTGAGVSNVETIALTNATTIGRTFDATGVTGATKYTIDASNAAVSLSDIKTAIDLSVSGQKDGSFSVSFEDVKDTTADVVGGTEDKMTLSLSSMGAVEDTATTATERKVVTATINSIEELTIDTTGANVIALGSDSAKTIVVTGSGSIEIDDIGTAATSFDASAVTGSVTVDTTQAATGKLTSIKTGTADDKITLNSDDIIANATISGGDGNDTVVWNGNTKTTQVSMTGVETIQLAALAGTELFSGANTSGVSTIKVDKDTGNQDVTFATMGTGAMTLEMVGANGNNTKAVSIDSSGAATLNINADDATVAKGTANTTAQAMTYDASLTKASELTVNVGAYQDTTSDITAAEATSVTLNIASGKNSATTPAELTEFSGTITAAKATTAVVNATGTFNGSVVANAASSVRLEATGAVSGAATLEADVATSAELTTGASASAVKLNVAKAQTIAINAGGDLTITTDDDFGSVQELTIDTAGAFSGNLAYADMASLNVSGTNSKSAVTVGALGGENDYNMTVVATGMKGGFTTGALKTGNARDISVTTSGVTGNVQTGDIEGTNVATLDINNVTLTSVGNTGNVQYGTIRADGTVSITNSSTGTFTVGNIGATAGAIPSTVTLNLDGTSGAMSIGSIAAGTVNFDASSATGAITFNSPFTVTKAFTFVGSELQANDVDFVVDSTSNKVTGSMTGSIANDTFLVTTNTGDTNGIGTFSVDGGVGTGDTLTIDAGTNSQDFITTAMTISGIETITIDSDTGDLVTLNASSISGQTIDLIGGNANDDFTLTGTDSTETIDLSNMTTSGNDIDLFVKAGKGDDTIKLTAATVSAETLQFGTTGTTNGNDTVSTFQAGEDFIDFLFGETGELAAIASLRGTGADLDTDGGTAGNGLAADTGFLTSSAQQADLEISTAITYLTAYVGGTASSDLVADDELYFALDNGTDTAIYYYHDIDSGADVDTGEVVKIATLVGLNAAESITGTETVDFT